MSSLFLLDERIKNIKKEIAHCPDLTVRNICVGTQKVAIIYLKSMMDKNLLLEGIVSPLINYKGKELDITTISQSVLKVPLVEQCEDDNEIVQSIVQNKTVLLVDKFKQFLTMELDQYPLRTPSEPPTSSVLKGPREGFTESIKTNITLLRRRFPNKDFAIDNLRVGRYTKTQISLCYLKGVADSKVIQQIKKTLNKIDIDGIIDSNYITEFLEERPNSLFRQIGTAEKPDIISARILEGRVAIIVDGSPIVLSLPFLFLEDIQNSNDYYTNSHYVTYIRVIRMIGLLIATILPGIYLSLRLYHYKVVPLKYLITIANSTQNLPFTPFMEILFILILFQVLYEVSLRLPQYLGLATSVVGALILGDTGVKAGLISPPAVIIIAVSLIASYTVPDQQAQLAILRLVFLLLGAMLGLLGIFVGIVYIINYLNSLEGYGAPYLAPFSPSVRSDSKDGILKRDLLKMKKRPQSFRNKNKVRQK